MTPTPQLRPETRAALLLALTRIERLLAGETDPEALGLIERARYDLRHGWPEAALDALGRARRLLETREAAHVH